MCVYTYVRSASEGAKVCETIGRYPAYCTDTAPPLPAGDWHVDHAMQSCRAVDQGSTSLRMCCLRPFRTSGEHTRRTLGNIPPHNEKGINGCDIDERLDASGCAPQRATVDRHQALDLCDHDAGLLLPLQRERRSCPCNASDLDNVFRHKADERLDDVIDEWQGGNRTSTADVLVRCVAKEIISELPHDK